MTDANRNDALNAVAKLLTAMNEVCETGVGLTIADIEEMFTADCEMTVNGTFICKGHEGLLLHSRDIGDKLQTWHFNLPFERTVVEGGEVFVYYTCDVTGHDGSPGKVFDMCIYSVRNGKISGVCEVVHFEGQTVRLDSY